MRMAQALIGKGDYAACERFLREGVQLGEAAAANPATAKEWGVRNGLANIYATLGDLKVRQGLDREAVEPYEKQLEIRTGLLKDSDPTPGQAGVAISETKLGEAWSRSGHPIEALPHLRRADEITTGTNSSSTHAIFPP